MVVLLQWFSLAVFQNECTLLESGVCIKHMFGQTQANTIQKHGVFHFSHIASLMRYEFLIHGDPSRLSVST